MCWLFQAKQILWEAINFPIFCQLEAVVIYFSFNLNPQTLFDQMYCMIAYTLDIQINPEHFIYPNQNDVRILLRFKSFSVYTIYMHIQLRPYVEQWSSIQKCIWATSRQQKHFANPMSVTAIYHKQNIEKLTLQIFSQTLLFIPTRKQIKRII